MVCGEVNADQIYIESSLQTGLDMKCLWLAFWSLLCFPANTILMQLSWKMLIAWAVSEVTVLKWAVREVTILKWAESRQIWWGVADQKNLYNLSSSKVLGSSFNGLKNWCMKYVFVLSYFVNANTEYNSSDFTRVYYLNIFFCSDELICIDNEWPVVY